MNNRFLIPSDRIDEDDLGDLVASIRSVTKAEAFFEKQFVITSNSPAVIDALKTLFGDVPAAVQSKIKKEHKTKVKAAAKKPRGRYVKSWEIVSTGQKVNAAELREMLAKHALPDGTIVRHPKHGFHQVQATAENDPHTLVKGEQA